VKINILVFDAQDSYKVEMKASGGFAMWARLKKKIKLQL